MAATLRCRCGAQKDSTWHLVCASCWAKVPEALRVEAYDALREQQGSERHLTACRQVFQALGPIGGAK